MTNETVTLALADNQVRTLTLAGSGVRPAAFVRDGRVLAVWEDGMADYYAKVGETPSPSTVVARDGGQALLPLETATAITANMRLRGPKQTIFAGRPCTIGPAATGTFSIPWQASDFLTAGTYELDALVSWPDGTTTIVPKPDYLLVLVQERA